MKEEANLSLKRLELKEIIDIFVMDSRRERNPCSLSAERMAYYKDFFAEPEVISREEAENALIA